MKIDTAQTSEKIRQKLKLKSIEAKNNFTQKHSNAEKFLQEKGISVGKLRHHSGKVMHAGVMSGLLLLSQPSALNYLPQTTYEMEKVLPAATPMPAETSKGVLLTGMSTILPEKVQPLERSQEKSLEKLFKETLGIDAKATLEGEHLNTTYGYIGAEQHLRRYPGDTVSQHDDADGPHDEGMAPGLGAWGYFAPTKEALTPDLVEKEKWYAVAQTLYLPDWNTRTRYLRDWYKYRKVLIVNTQNGKAVVADIADSGPAAWTGKHYGGSPAVMNYLGGDRYKKGAVLFFFVDDPNNEISLGPVEYN